MASDWGPTERAELAKEGEYWAISHGERVLRVGDSKGMRYLAELLSRPGEEIDVLVLATGRPAHPLSAAAVADAGLADGSTSGGGPLLDERARREYGSRLNELRGEIDEAEVFNDPERAARARVEYDTIVDELASATGLGGRDRRQGSPAERARLNVSRAIRSAIGRIAEHDEALGGHLSERVHTGRVCVYRPDHGASPTWTVRISSARPRARRQPTPDTRYAKKGEISIAYQTLGDGPFDVILVNGLMGHIDLWWAEPHAAAALRRIASFSRLTIFDKPGSGLSDPVAGAPSIEQRVEDIRAVMDAVGSDRASLIGYSEGGLASAVFAAIYPERTDALVLLNTAPQTRIGPEATRDAYERAFEPFWWICDEIAAKRWGEGRFILECAPSWKSSELHRRMSGIAERALASPGMVRAMVEALHEYDIRTAVPSISVPTLVIHTRDDPLVPVEGGRAFAALIPGARLIELPGRDHIFYAVDSTPVVSQIEEFLTGDLPQPDETRALQTVLVVRIESPRNGRDARADERLLEFDDDLLRALAEFGGHVIDWSGTTMSAAFDGPGRAVRCAFALNDTSRQFGHGLSAAVHTGECTRAGGRLDGPAIQTAVKIAALVQPSEILASQTARDLAAGSGIQFIEHGQHRLDDGDGDELKLHRAVSDHPRDARPMASVDHVTAMLTPAASDGMKTIDRAAMSFAHHAPRISRFGFRLSHAVRRSRAN